jgi:hypothetical protein
LLLKEESGKLVSKWLQNVKTFKQFKEDLVATDIDSETSALGHESETDNPPAAQNKPTDKNKKVKKWKN